MALIMCYECGHRISDLAESCPNCGAPARRPRQNEQHTFRPVETYHAEPTNKFATASGGNLIGCLLITIGVFLPFFFFGTTGFYFLFNTGSIDWIILLAIAGISALVMLFRLYYVTLFAGILATVVLLLDAMPILLHLGEENSISLGIGFYVSGAGAALLAAFSVWGIMLKKAERREDGSLRDRLQGTVSKP